MTISATAAISSELAGNCEWLGSATGTDRLFGACWTEKRSQVAVIVVGVCCRTQVPIGPRFPSRSTVTGVAVSRKVGPSGVGRRKRTSKPAVMNGTGAPGATCHRVAPLPT